MNAWTAWSIARFWSIVLLFMAFWAAPSHAQQMAEEGDLPEGDSHIAGVVLDISTGEPVPGVTVTVRFAETGESAARFTSESGEFLFSFLAEGEYLIDLSRLGYRPLDLSIDVEEDDRKDVRIQMVPQAVELDPVVVVSTRRTRLDRVGFSQRERTTGGHFFTRDEIQDRNLFNLSDLFRTLSGFRVVPSGRGSGSVVLGRGNCVPNLYIDGMRLQTVAGQIDEVLRPDHLEGLEVYTAAQTPGQFDAGRCGTVVAWTHTPEPGIGHAFDWRRLGIVGGLVVLGFLFVF